MWDKSRLKYMHWDEPDESIIEKEKEFLKKNFRLNDIALPYRLFVPKVRARVPLVIYLHGADDRHDDNVYHIIHHENACVFAQDSWQMKRPCYILAPHCPEKKFWEQDDMKKALKGLIDDVLGNYEYADPAKIYIYGNSMGAVGAMAMIKDYPELFSRALAICGATDSKNLDAFSGVSLVLVHAEDDKIVKPTVSYSMMGQELLGSAALYDALTKNGKRDVFIKMYPEGSLMKTYGINAHCSWFPALRDEIIKGWFFGNLR